MGTEPSAAQEILGQPPLTVASWGGSYARSQMVAYIRPYRQTTRRWVNVEIYRGGLDQVRAQVRSLNVKWDIVDFELPDAISACNEGLLYQIDVSKLMPGIDGTPPRQDFLPGTLSQCAVAHIVFSTVVAYDPRRLGRAPTQIADFFDLRKFPGRRGLKQTARQNLEWALMADGVAPNQVYAVLSKQAGVNRAFRVLDRIKGQIVWWRDGETPIELLSSGQVVMSSAWNGRVFSAVKDRGASLAITWDGQVWDVQAWGILNGSERVAEAFDFIRFATDPRRLAQQAALIAYGPARRSASRAVSQNVKRYLPTHSANLVKALRIDHAWWSTNGAALEAQFARWITEPPFRYDFSPDDRS